MAIRTNTWDLVKEASFLVKELSNQKDRHYCDGETPSCFKECDATHNCIFFRAHSFLEKVKALQTQRVDIKQSDKSE